MLHHVLLVGKDKDRAVPHEGIVNDGLPVLSVSVKQALLQAELSCAT